MDAIQQDLAIVRNDVSAIAEVSPLCTHRHSDGVMSFDPKTEEGAIMLIKAELLQQRELKELTNQTINIRHIFAKPIDDVDDNGEVNRYVRIVLFDDSGAAFSCGSKGVLKSLSVLLAIRGPMPWNPPIACTVKVTTLANKQNWMTCEPDLKKLFPASHNGKAK
ncbi:hypothetical protein MUP79_05460 [Candidatus Bathyarchaeota archaeon]|nr:hypothetical protein [Candidatus Bathyarchaeota archaeon]